MPNVLSVIHYPIFGGPANRSAMVANYLAPHGVTSHMVIPAEPGNAATRLAEYGITPIQIDLHRIRALKDPAVHLRYVRSLRSEVAAIRRIIRERDIDVVIVNGSANPHGALAARAEGVGLVWQLIDTFPPAAFLSVMMRAVVRWSDVIMTNGMTVAAMHPGAMEFEGPLINFGPCIPVERFTHDPVTAQKARADLGLDPDAFVVGTVNNLNPMKGHVTFLRAAALLKQSQPQCKFVILGAEHHREYTQLLHSEAARLGLQLDRDLVIRDAGARVHELAQAMDTFWLTSEPRSEGMSNALAEAQSLGIPVVSTRAGSVHECMRDRETGFLVPPHDVHRIAEVTERLITDTSLRSRMSLAGAAHVRANFSVREVALRHAEAFEAAVEAKRSRSATPAKRRS